MIISLIRLLNKQRLLIVITKKITQNVAKEKNNWLLVRRLLLYRIISYKIVLSPIPLQKQFVFLQNS